MDYVENNPEADFTSNWGANNGENSSGEENGDSLPGLPNIDDIPNPESVGPLTRQETLDYYLMIRKLLWQQCGLTCVDPVTGMIKDEYLVALIILGEFGAYKGGKSDNVYWEGIEAISNEYYSAADLNYTYVGGMLCNGACTVSTQLSWLYDIEAIRSDSFVILVSQGKWNAYLDDAKLAIAPGGYSRGTDSSWHWGNINQDQLNNYCITAQASPSMYSGTDYFIVYSCKK